MINPMVVGSFTVLSPGTTAWFAIFPVSDAMNSAVYQSGQIPSTSVTLTLARGNYQLMFGTYATAPLQVFAAFSLMWYQ
jgi:hypothetical protein